MKTELKNETYYARLSVREFVEFVCRSGDLDSRGGMIDPQAMREGQRLHKKIQDFQPECYTAEAALSAESSVVFKGETFIVALDGRADGVIATENPIEKFNFENPELSLFESSVFIDEIKCMYADVFAFEEPLPVHLAQAKCYAYFMADKCGLDKIGVQMTYCNIDTEKTRFFTFEYTKEELESWFIGLVLYYAKWLHWEKHHIADRNTSLRSLEFPFEYREGQKDLVKSIYLSFLRKKKIFIEAPTGVGKTIAALFPAAKAMGEGLCRKIFYLTARTITRTVAEETAGLLENAGAEMLCLTLTAKEKICIFEKSDCNPLTCERAKGHEDRVNEAVFDLICHEKLINRQVVETYAEKHKVCPFEFALDVSLWCDMVICDYNYCFDPDVYLRRFFTEEHLGDYALLVDEAHNLVDRAREMYSSVLSKKRLLETRPLLKAREETRKLFTKVANAMDRLNKAVEEERDFTEDDFGSGFGEPGSNYSMRRVVSSDDCVKIFSAATKLFERLKAWISDRKNEPPEEVLDFFFELRTFVMTLAEIEENYRITLDGAGRNLRISLNCMNPRERLASYMQFYRGVALFSATLLPVKYYMEQLCGSEEDYAVYAPSPFDQRNRLILVAKDVSAKYSRRSRSEYIKHMEYIDKLIHARAGNYLVFFPSYKVMDEIYKVFLEEYGGFEENFDFGIAMQKTDMSEEEREEFLSRFTEKPEKSFVGFCVMGGIFSEGIDLRSDRLIGVAIVGTGLPMVGDERELFKNYYDEISGSGFEHAYLWPGMNKVLQAGGRVIRTEEDRGVILLLDDRFLKKEYNSLFPKEWNEYIITDRNSVEEELEAFWNKNRKD